MAKKIKIPKKIRIVADFIDEDGRREFAAARKQAGFTDGPKPGTAEEQPRHGYDAADLDAQSYFMDVAGMAEAEWLYVAVAKGADVSRAVDLEEGG
jgi:hypothetical protein